MSGTAPWALCFWRQCSERVEGFLDERSTSQSTVCNITFARGTWTSIAFSNRTCKTWSELNHAITLGIFNGGRWIEDEEGTSIETTTTKKAKFVSSKEPGSTFMTNLCLSMRDGFIKLSHMKVICGR